MISSVQKKDQRGFTIVELLIATAVLSTLLVVVSVMMANIGRLYYKGINQAKMQDNVRSVVDEISDRLQLNNTSVGTTTSLSGVIEAYCIGTSRYTFVLNQQLKDNPGAGDYKHVLWRDTIPAGACGKANLRLDDPSATSLADVPGQNGSELITTRSRLNKFSINPITSPYIVTMRLVYGDDDQLDDPSIPGIDPNIGNPKCISQTGSQFCAAAALTTTVVQRTISGN